MASTSSNFVVPLPPVVKVEVEEQVVPKDFRGYLTRALAWTALMPLFMLAFMHFSQLTHTAAVIDDQQIMRTQQFARSMSARIVSIETFFEHRRGHDLGIDRRLEGDSGIPRATARGENALHHFA